MLEQLLVQVVSNFINSARSLSFYDKIPRWVDDNLLLLAVGTIYLEQLKKLRKKSR